MKKLAILASLLGLSTHLYADNSQVGKIESVEMFEECMVVKIEGDGHAYVYPNSSDSFNAKLSIALSALNTGKDVKINGWGTSACASLNDRPDAKPTGSFKYLYSIKQEM